MIISPKTIVKKKKDNYPKNFTFHYFPNIKQTTSIGLKLCICFLSSFIRPWEQPAKKGGAQPHPHSVKLTSIEMTLISDANFGTCFFLLIFFFPPGNRT